MKSNWDVIVVGAGAAGLYAAATSAARGRSTLLIEKNKKLGVKILMSGGTRCNITQDTNWKGIADAFGKQQGRFLKYALATLTPQQIVAFFHDNGVPTKIESTGKIFPTSDKAIDVRDALVQRARNNGAQVLNETAVEAIERNGNALSITAGEQSFSCKSAILTSGGQSYPGCGTTGDGYHWLRQLGHRIVAARPALTPLRLGNQWARDLSGVTVPDVCVSIRMEGNNERRDKKTSERDRYSGSFLFTHKGCSGPAVLNISRVVTDPDNNVQKSLICDWLPQIGEDRLRNELTNEHAHSTGKQLGNSLARHLPRRVVAALCDNAEIAIEQTLSELGRKRLSKIIEQTKRCPLAISGTLGFAKAEVTAGGVSLDEVDPKTMESRIVPGLFLAGEILDVDGPIGGYNFQAAFSTGFVAGSNVCTH